MQQLGEGLGEPVGQRLDHDRVVDVVLLFEAPRRLVRPETCGNREEADVIF